MMTREEVLDLLSGALGYDRTPEHVREEQALIAVIDLFFVRLDAAEKCIKAADVALEPALEVRTWNMMSKTSRDDIDTFSVARAAWEATK